MERWVDCGGLLKIVLPMLTSHSCAEDSALNDTTNCNHPLVSRVFLSMWQALRTKYMVDQLQYVSLAGTRRSSLVQIVGKALEPERSGDFDDRTKYCGAELSYHYLRDVWHMWFSSLPVLGVHGVAWTREDDLHRVHQRWDGWILAGGASFRFILIILLRATASGQRTRPAHGIYTVFNEFEQVKNDRTFRRIVAARFARSCLCVVFFFVAARFALGTFL